jgi:hypothetical protein
MVKISLTDLAHAIARSDVVQSYVDLKEGRVIALPDAPADAEDDAAAFDYAMQLEEDYERYLPLANLYDGVEPDAMRAFAEAQSAAMKARLLPILDAPGAAPRFRQQVWRLLLEAKWKAFLQDYVRDVARTFCEENEIEYEA